MKKTYPRYHYQIFVTYKELFKNRGKKKEVCEKFFISSVCEVWRSIDGKIEKLHPVHGFVSSGKYTTLCLVQKAFRI